VLNFVRYSQEDIIVRETKLLEMFFSFDLPMKRSTKFSLSRGVKINHKSESFNEKNSKSFRRILIKSLIEKNHFQMRL